MKFTIRIAVLMAMVAALMVMAPAAKPAQAQGTSGDIWQYLAAAGLKADDVALLQAASANLKDLNSFTMDYTLTAKVSGTGTSDGDVSVTGNGGFAIDKSKITMPAAGTTAMTMDPAATAAALNAITFQNTIKGTANMASGSKNASFEARIVGGVLYFMGDTATQGKWMKVNLADALKQAQASNPMMSGSGSTAAQAQIATLFSDPAILAALQSIPTIPGFITASRGDDVTVGDQPSAQISIVFDIGKLAAAKEIQPLIAAALKAQSGTAPDPSQVTQISTLAGTLLAKTSITVKWLVGTTDKQIHGFGLHVDATVDASMFTGSTTGPTVVNFDFLVKLTNLNQAVTVDVPTGAVDVPLSGLGGASAVATPAATAAQ